MTVLQPGQQIGPYQIIGLIGKGGMASVYKAHHAAMERYVALKVVSAQLSDDPTFLQRFQQEVRLIARLEHPHILPVHDYGEADGVPYMVMRYLDAGTLRERLDAGPLPLDEINRIFLQLADALAYAHENGVIHRDIKPSNAMLDKRGDVFLTDFGVAKLIEGTAALTATGAITGTPAYMSPEQAQGIKVDARSDIYSLGIVLFEMLTGRVPFEAETPLAVIFKQIQDPPPPLSAVRPGLPDSIEAVLLKALAKNPADRYANIHEFLEAWKRAYQDAAVSVSASQQAATQIPARVEPIPPPAKPMPPARRINWKSIALGCGGVFVLIVALAFAFVVYPRITERTSTQTSQTETTPSSPAAGDMFSAGRATSWAAGNTISAIVPLGDAIYTSGGGGMVMWNPVSGTPTQFTTRDGIPDSWTPALYRDSLDDSLWIGSSSGLAHIVNGKVTQVFTEADGLDSRSVTAITRLDGKTLLVGTNYCGYNGCGLMTFDGMNFKAVDGFPSAGMPEDDQVRYDIQALLVDNDKEIWAATADGIALLDGENDWNVFKTINGLTDNSIYSLMQDSQGDIWAGTAAGGVDVFDWEAWAFNERFNLTERSIVDVLSIVEDSDGNVWFSGFNVARYNRAENKWTVFTSDDGSLPVWGSTVLTIDDKDVVYVGSYEGLLRYDGSGFEHWYIPNTVNITSFGHIIHGSDDLLYFVSQYSNNANIYNPANDAWNWDDRTRDGASPMAADTIGNVWYGSPDGLWIYTGGQARNVTAEYGLVNSPINAVAVTSGNTAYYVATDDGLMFFDGTKAIRAYSRKDMGLDSSRVVTLYIANDGALWAADDLGGIVTRLNADGTWSAFNVKELFGLDTAPVTDFAEAQDGALWVATLGNGAYRLANGEWKHISSMDPGVGLPNDNINCIMAAPDGALWFGMEEAGALRFDGTNWSRYDLKDGLINRNVNDIYFMADGSAWFATSGGVTRFK